eukprot:CAMPEP_0197734674 /NCGR_PEP_ID=MMETSP1434-20131217/44545_1 /TAXON_ID=265543 /ORGANISM="Minutocellus polymorphus, Strain CCMP3303" /LENGTH=390 /DNA_ID=CAMNT_0043322097 /DNA_START=96 /DNA_END=1265 /DNA_ORIENTATION=+
MPTCSACRNDLPRKGFSKGQLKKNPCERKCKECVEEMEAEEQRYRSGYDDRQDSLRFGVGDRVECKMVEDGWRTGTIIRLWYVERTSAYDEAHPYQVHLDIGAKIYAPEDRDRCIRQSNEPPQECTFCYDNEMTPDNLIVRGCACRGDGGGFVHVNCLTRSVMLRVEAMIKSGKRDRNKRRYIIPKDSYNPFTTCGTCKQHFSSDDPSAIALADHCYERFKDDEDENPFLHSFSIQNLSDAMVADGRLDEACTILNERAAKIYEKTEKLTTITRRGMYARSSAETKKIVTHVFELEDELCDILLKLVGIDIDRDVSMGCITAVLSQAKYLNERSSAGTLSCYSCRKADILQKNCFVAWDDGDLERALQYVEEALSTARDHGEHANELALS